jgi:hypothetical protein
MGIPSAADIAALQADPPSVPMDLATLSQAVLQLQNTTNEIIARFNATNISYGCLVAPDVTHAYNLAVGAGEIVVAGVPYEFAAVVAQSPPACTTSAGQYRSILCEVDETDAAYFTTSATAASAAAALALLPAATAGRVTVATIAVPPSFTAATTSFTAAMITNSQRMNPITGLGAPATNLFTAS